VERAEALVPKVAAAAEQTDRDRSVSSEILQDVIDAGFPRILVPERFGGFELDIETMLAVVRPIAAACPSTGWVLAFYIGHAWVHALYPEEAQVEAFKDRPFTLSPGTVAPSYRYSAVPGGYQVNGRQAWNSGINHADWVFCPGFVEGDMERGPMLGFVPKSSLTVLDTWRILGMRGTGSHDVVAKDVFVPGHRVISLLDILGGTTPGAELHGNPLYSRPFLPIALSMVTSVIVSAYVGAADEFVRVSKRRLATYTGEKVAQKVPTQMRIARGLTRADMLNTLLSDFIATVANPDLTELREPSTRAALKAKSAMIADMARDGINDLLRGAGADQLRDEAPLQRYFRDISTMSLHAFFDPETATETYGRVLIGLEPQAFL
jgi:3-hydroxy-9,10-secoandrosta-1,3,5(10)-triene-9,17-dione monooxygenase